MGRPKGPRNICSVQECDATVVGRGLCSKHYRRFQRLGSVELPPRPQRALCSRDGCKRTANTAGLCGYHNPQSAAYERTCSVVGCDSPVWAQGMCDKHYMRMRRTGSTDGRPPPRRSPCSECGKPSAAFGLCDTHYRASRATHKVQHPRPCRTCEQEFVPYNARQGYCSVVCKTRAIAMRSKYGIDVPDYRRILAAQGNACAICRAPAPEDLSLHVDHCHGSGAVRGLLCGGCNIGLGCFNDQPESLRAAADYLEAQPR